MINLLPPEGKRTVRHEYIIRVASVWMLLISGVVIAVSLMLIPTYVLLTQKEEALSIAYDRLITNDQTEYDEAIRVVREANEIAGRLNLGSEILTASTIFENIENTLTPQIKLQSFSYVYAEDGVAAEIEGTAATRESLVNFRDDLERNPLFLNATVPVSSLARNEDLPFHITLVLNQTQ